MASVSSANRTSLPVPGQGSAAQPGGSMGDVPRDPTPGVPERLVQATIGLLAKQGPSAIKARTVASASGLSTIAVYHYFGGIAELMRAVVDHGFIELDRAVAQVLLPMGVNLAVGLGDNRERAQSSHEVGACLYDSITRQ